MNVSLNAWFLNGYVIVLCFAPIIEKVFRDEERVKILLPFIILIFGWTFLSELPYLTLITPKASGIGSYSGLTLLGVYVCGRLARFYERHYPISKRVTFIVLLSCLLMCMLGFGNYASLFAVIVALCLFSLFKLVTPSAIVQKLIAFFGASLFSVYLLHSNCIGFQIIKDLESVICIKGIFGCVCCAMVVMVGCLMLDIPRRLIVWCMRSPLQLILNWIDWQWGVFNDSLESHLEDRHR